MPTTAGSRRPLLILALLALGLRLALFLAVRPWAPEVETRFVLAGDAGGYHRIATTLIAAHRFAYAPDDAPNALRTPGYPFMVAGLYALAGARPWVVLLVQLALDVASCLLLYRLALPHLGRRPALLTAGLYALDPFLALYASTTLLSDSLFVFLLVLATWVLAKALVAPAPRAQRALAAASGLLLGLHVLTRPVSQFLFVVFLGVLAIARRGHAREALVQVGLLLLTFVATLAPVLARNQVVLGRLALSSSDAYNLLVLDVVPLEMERRGQDMHAVERALLAEADERMRGEGRDPASLNELQKAPYWRELALEYIRRDPGGFARSYAVGVVHMFGNVGTSVFSSAFGWPQREFEIKRYAGPRELVAAFVRSKGPAAIALAALLAAFLLLTYVFACVGLTRVVRRPELWPAAATALAIAGYFVLITGVAGLVRFKLPAIPFYLPFAGLGLAALSGRPRAGHPGR